MPALSTRIELTFNDRRLRIRNTDLAARNALLLENFDADAENEPTPWTKIAYASGGLIAASGLMVIGALVHFWLLARPLAASIGEPVTQILLIGGLLCGIWLGLRYENRQARR